MKIKNDQNQTISELNANRIAAIATMGPFKKFPDAMLWGNIPPFKRVHYFLPIFQTPNSICAREEAQNELTHIKIRFQLVIVFLFFMSVSLSFCSSSSFLSPGTTLGDQYCRGDERSCPQIAHGPVHLALHCCCLWPEVYLLSRLWFRQSCRTCCDDCSASPQGHRGRGMGGRGGVQAAIMCWLSLL